MKKTLEQVLIEQAEQMEKSAEADNAAAPWRGRHLSHRD